MHTLLDLRGNIPSFIHISDGKLGDVKALDIPVLEAGAIYVMDRRVYSAPVDRSTGIICDQTIALTGTTSCKDYPEHLMKPLAIRLGWQTTPTKSLVMRRIRYKNPDTGKTLILLTNNLTLPAATICALYKARW